MFCSIQLNTYNEVVLVAIQAFHIIQKAMSIYPSLQYSQTEMVRLWDDRRVIPDADGDEGAPPSYPDSARPTIFL